MKKFCLILYFLFFSTMHFFMGATEEFAYDLEKSHTALQLYNHEEAYPTNNKPNSFTAISQNINSSRTPPYIADFAINPDNNSDEVIILKTEGRENQRVVHLHFQNISGRNTTKKMSFLLDGDNEKILSANENGESLCYSPLVAISNDSETIAIGGYGNLIITLKKTHNDHNNQEEPYAVESIQKLIKDPETSSMMGLFFDMQSRNSPDPKYCISTLKFFDNNTLLIGTKFETMSTKQKEHRLVLYSLAKNCPEVETKKFYPINQFIIPWWYAKKFIAVAANTLSFCTLDQKNTFIDSRDDFEVAGELSTIACHPTEKNLIFTYRNTHWIDVFNPATRLIIKKLAHSSSPIHHFCFIDKALTFIEEDNRSGTRFKVTSIDNIDTRPTHDFEDDPGVSTSQFATGKATIMSNSSYVIYQLPNDPELTIAKIKN